MYICLSTHECCVFKVKRKLKFGFHTLYKSTDLFSFRAALEKKMEKKI